MTWISERAPGGWSLEVERDGGGFSIFPCRAKSNKAIVEQVEAATKSVSGTMITNFVKAHGAEKEDFAYRAVQELSKYLARLQKSGLMKEVKFAGITFRTCRPMIGG